VDDAIEAAELLRARGIEVVLLHARFAMGDRLDVEDRVRTILGPNDQTGRRRGFVLVGTQILEQSLDYDVDAMVTDLAPVDLMIQRAGRLWRHSARTGRPVDAPELVVLSSDPDIVENKDWYRKLSSRAAAVYDHHGIVWRSARALFDTGHIATPVGVRKLVEQVYANSAFDDIPEPLRVQSNKAVGVSAAARSFAGANLLYCWDGYGGSAGLWNKDTITTTRLGQPVTLFRLGKIEAGRIVSYYSANAQVQDLARDWALSEVSLNQNKATGVPLGEVGRERLIGDAKASWPEWERDLPLLVLEPNGTGWRGFVSGVGEDVKPVIYSARVGLKIVST
jgi:CRISPR-associated endonuclease/helicase Cas3